MKLCMAGIDASAPFEEREKLSLVRGQVQAMLPRIAEQTGCAAVLLATCSRTELYLHAEGERALPDPAEALCRAAGVAASAFVTRREGADAVRHLMHVAAGMQSQIFGDDQIVSQVKDAVALAREAKTTDAVLDTLFRRAVTAGKRVRTETRLTGVPASAAEVGVRRAERFFGSLAGRRAVVIGNGEMGRLAARALVRAGSEVTVTLRTYRHGETLVPQGCGTVPYARRLDAIEGADLVVSATTSPHFTLTAAQMQTLLCPPRLLLDLAMPRDIESTAAGAQTALFNLDDLGDLGDADDTSRETAECILDEETREFFAWLNYRAALPLIAKIKSAAIERVRHMRDDDALAAEGDAETLAELAVSRAVELVLGGMKEKVNVQSMKDCLEHIRKGSGR
ncbi:glutamyl-tRNA reductase [Agathobaculum sp.]|uniref:glutamyl-tRNA reductase n=1 Tax=Agathobaculum sp. TaxID=2048138 RepID=UPI003AF189F8